MASTAYPAQGTTLKVDDTTPGTADVLVANFRSWSVEPAEAPDVDKTNLSSVKREYYTGLAGSGTLTVEWHVDLDDAGQTAIREAEGDASNKKTLMFTFPNAKTMTYQGYIKSASGMSGAIDATIDGGFSMIIDGVPVEG